MAAQINKSFVIGVLSFVVLAGIGVAGLWYLSIRSDATRNIRAGDAALKAGDLNSAYKLYGRAVYKEPGNYEYVKKMEDVLLQIRPDTVDRAAELYRERMGMLRHKVSHDPYNADIHVDLLVEMHQFARRVGSIDLWEALGTAANEMWMSVPEDNPKRVYAQLYRAMSKYRLMEFRPEDLASAEAEISDVLELIPNNDLAWATAIAGQMAVGRKLLQERQPQTILSEHERKIDTLIVKSDEAVPNGPETARMKLLRMAMQSGSDPGSVSEEKIERAVDHLIMLLRGEVKPALISEAIDLISTIPKIGRGRAIEFLESSVIEESIELDGKLTLARLQYYSDRLEESEATINSILDAEQLPISLMALLQFDLRMKSASLLVDIQNRRFEQATEIEKSQRLDALITARDKLSLYVTDQTGDPMILRADGKIAYAKGDFQEAAQLFENLLRMQSDAEVLAYSAACQDRLGNIGLAHERISRALTLVPNRSHWVLAKAGLEVRMGRYEDARSTIDSLPENQKESPEALALVSAILRRTNANTESSSDPIDVAIQNARESMAAGDFASARAILKSALESSPDNVLILLNLAQLELRAENREMAQSYLNQGLELEPTNRNLNWLKASMSFRDPIESMSSYLTSSIESEADRSIQMLAYLISLALRQDAQLKRFETLGDSDQAENSRDLRDRAWDEAENYANIVRQKSPNSDQLIEYEFARAASHKNWSLAEEVVSRAKSLNSDQAVGLLYLGRLEILRENYPAAVQALEQAVNHISYSARAWRSLGFAYIRLGNYAQARRAYEQAYLSNPNDIEAVKELVSLLQRQGDQERALQILRRAYKFAPQDVWLRDEWLSLEADIGNSKVALETRMGLYEQMSDDRSRQSLADRANAAALAKLLIKVQPNRDMIIGESGEILYSDQRWQRMNPREKDHIISIAKSEWESKSNEIMTRLLADASSDEKLRLTVQQSEILRLQGSITKGEQLLQNLIGQNDDPEVTVQLLIELGRYQMRSKHFTEAISTFEEAIDNQDPINREADLQLAQLYMQLRQFDKALDHFAAVDVASPSYARKTQITECLIKLGRFDEAEEKLSAIVGSGQEDIVTTMLTASIAEGRADELMAEGNQEAGARMYRQQRDALARAQDQDPTSPTPRLLLAQSFIREYGFTRQLRLLDDALQTLDEVDRIRSGVEDTSMMRVTVLKEKNDMLGAIAELRKVVEKSPDNALARRELIQLYLAKGDTDDALKVVNDGISRNPTLWAWHDIQGDIHRYARNDLKEAIKSYVQAYEAAPSSSLHLQLVETLLATSPSDCRAAIEWIESAQTFLEEVPRLRELYAQALVCVGRREDALNQTRLAWSDRRDLIESGMYSDADIAPWFQLLPFLFQFNESSKGFDVQSAEQFVMELCENAPGVIENLMLGRLWMLTGIEGRSRGSELLSLAMRQCSADNANLRGEIAMDLANALLTLKDYVGAAKSYAEVIELNPKNVLALNNLAYVNIENLNNPKEAMQYASQAVDLAPDDPSVLDTAGWVYFKNGEIERGKYYLQRSIRMKPNIAAYLHLAEIFLSEGNRSEAKGLLEGAEKLGITANDQIEVDRLYEAINNADN